MARLRSSDISSERMTQKLGSPRSVNKQTIIGIDDAQRRTIMVIRITLALALVILALAAVPILAGPGVNLGLASLGSGGGNLVPLW
jgi:hypothetical protein